MVQANADDRQHTVPTTVPPASDGAATGHDHLAKNKLGVLAVAFFVIASATPLGGVVAAAPMVFSIVGPSTPVVYLLGGLTLAVFAVGYLAMSRHVTSAGGFIAYIYQGMGRVWATAGAGLAFVTYIAFQVAVWALFGGLASSLTNDLVGVSIPPVVWLIVFLPLSTILVTRGTDASLGVLGLLVILQIIAIAGITIATVAHRGVSAFGFEGFAYSSVVGPGLGLALLFAILSFAGFEATVVFSEEARRPHRTIPRAMYLVVGFLGAFFAFSAWVITSAIGAANVRQAASDDPAGLLFNVAAEYGGHAFSEGVQILVAVAYFATLLSLANMFARYLFALGRAGALPAPLAEANDKGSPARAAVANTVIVGVISTGLLLWGSEDPVTMVFAPFSALATSSLIIIFILASIAVIIFFARSQHSVNPLVCYVAPGLSVILFAWIGWLAVSNYDLLGGTATWAKPLLLVIPVAFVAGLVRGIRKKTIDFADVPA